MTPELAADLAARTKAAIDATAAVNGYPRDCVAADRERVDSDLAGLSDHDRLRCEAECADPCPDAARYTAGLVRTAALYGVAP